jgi:hypothetical protein
VFDADVIGAIKGDLPSGRGCLRRWSRARATAAYSVGAGDSERREDSEADDSAEHPIRYSTGVARG